MQQIDRGIVSTISSDACLEASTAGTLLTVAPLIADLLMLQAKKHCYTVFMAGRLQNWWCLKIDLQTRQSCILCRSLLDIYAWRVFINHLHRNHCTVEIAGDIGRSWRWERDTLPGSMRCMSSTCWIFIIFFWRILRLKSHVNQ